MGKNGYGQTTDKHFVVTEVHRSHAPAKYSGAGRRKYGDLWDELKLRLEQTAKAHVLMFSVPQRNDGNKIVGSLRNYAKKDFGSGSAVSLWVGTHDGQWVVCVQRAKDYPREN